MRAGWFYLRWYPKQWLPAMPRTSGMDPALKKHVRYAARQSKKLARKMFHAMAMNGPKLEREQMLLARFVDIGTELFAQTASATRAQALIEHGQDRKEILALVDHFCAESRLRIDRAFRGIRTNNDHMGYRLAQNVLKGRLRLALRRHRRTDVRGQRRVGVHPRTATRARYRRGPQLSLPKTPVFKYA